MSAKFMRPDAALRRALARPAGAVVAVAAVGWVAAWAAFPLDASTRTAWVNVMSFVLPFAAAFAAITAARTGLPRIRLPFLFLGLGLLSWGSGQVIWTYYESVAHEEPFPSAADGGFLLALPLFAAGLLTWPRRRSRSRMGIRFETVLAIAIAWLVGYEVAFAPIAENGFASAVEVLAFLYPVGDFVLLSVVLAGLLLDGWRERPRLVVVGVGLIGLIVADVAFALAPTAYAAGAMIDLGWAFAFTSIGVAALLPSPTPAASQRRPRTALVGGALTGSLVVLLGVNVADELDRGWHAAVEDALIGLALVLVVARALAVTNARDRQAAELRRAQVELRAAQATRNRFLLEMVTAQEQEARRIAYLLHDDAVQQLTALQLRLELEAHRSELPKLRQLAEDASGITASIRRLLVDLHPAVLESQGLAPAIDVLADGIRARGVEVEVTPFPHRLPIEVEVLGYRLVQEALGNIGRHSRAAHAKVDLSLVDDRLRVHVSDDGVGLAAASSGSGLGLFVARERVELSDGRFMVRSGADGGTDFAFELPVKRVDDVVEEIAS